MVSPDADPDLERLKFEQLKWQDEVRLRQLSIEIDDRAQRSKDEENELRRDELNRSRWSSPLVIAILGATLAAAGNLVVNIINANETKTLEKEKAEAARILEVVKTGDPDKAAVNLKVLLDTYLISDDFTRDHVQTYLDGREAGQGLALSSAGAPVASSVPQCVPLPAPTGKPPYRLELSSILGGRVGNIAKAGKLVFQVTGDSGGTQNYQGLVARSMDAEIQSANSEARSAFLYLLGNIVFFNGEAENYPAQFYSQYANYPAPIFAIPGNHDGSVPPGSQKPSLEGYVTNFSAVEQKAVSESYGRNTMIEPNVYWTLLTPFATIIGLYTNVPEGGCLDAAQTKWLHAEMKAAPQDRALIIAMHHSPVSFDSFHSGSSQMFDVLLDAINDLRRVPNAIFSAGVFNYQRIEFDIAGSKIPFFVIGSGGYPHLRKISIEPPASDPNTGAMLVAANGNNHGFATFEITAEAIKGHFTILGRPNDQTASGSTVADLFAYSSAPICLPAGVNLQPRTGLEDKAAVQ